MIIGEKIHEGALMYVGVWDKTGPLAAVVYWILDIIFGRSLLTYQLLGAFLFFIQAAYFNTFLIRRKAYNENTYIPAFVYALLGFLYFDMFTLSPQLLGLTFVLISLNSLFRHLETRMKVDANLISIGIFSGLAALFYLPYILLTLAYILGLLLYTSTLVRRYFLLLYGVLFAFLLVWLLYYWKGHIRELQIDYFNALFRVEEHVYIKFTALFLLSAFPILILTVSIFKVFSFPSFINYQVRIQSIFLISLITLTVAWYLYSERTGASIVFFVPFFSFFLTHFYLIIRKRIQREILYGIFTIYVILAGYAPNFNWFSLRDKVNISNLIVHPVAETEMVKNKKILVLGDNLNYYQNASLATPYLNWRLSNMQLGHLEYYDNLEEIYRNFSREKPEIIVDETRLVPQLFEKIPLLESTYYRVGDSQFYQLKSNSQ